MLSLDELHRLISAAYRGQELAEPVNYDILIRTAMGTPKSKAQLTQTAMACQLISYYSQSLLHAIEFAKQQDFPALLEHLTAKCEASNTAFKEVFRAALINFSIHRPTAEIYAQQRHITEAISNLYAYNADLSLILRLTDPVYRSVALKNAFLRMREGGPRDIAYGLAIACRLLVFKDMPHTFKPGEQELEQYFTEEKCEKEAVANALDCFALAAQISQESIIQFYGLIRESHLHWYAHDIGEELDYYFYAIGGCCVSLLESKRTDAPEEFGVS